MIKSYFFETLLNGIIRTSCRIQACFSWWWWSRKNYICKETLNRRIWEEIYCYSWSWSPSNVLLHIKRINFVQCLGYCRTRKARRSKRWLLHWWIVRNHYVRRLLKNHLLKCSKMVQRLSESMWEYSSLPCRKQSRC